MSVTINAPATKVWDALTQNDKRKQWFFGVETETDWKEGSPLVHTGEYQGKPYKDKGEILEIEPGRMLVHTHWSDMSGASRQARELPDGDLHAHRERRQDRR